MRALQRELGAPAAIHRRGLLPYSARCVVVFVELWTFSRAVYEHNLLTRIVCPKHIHFNLYRQRHQPTTRWQPGRARRRRRLVCDGRKVCPVVVEAPSPSRLAQ